MSSYKRKIQQINENNQRDLQYQRTYEESWHWKYRNNNEIYISGIAKELNEGDIIVVFSQYGEVIDIEMPRNNDETGINMYNRRRDSYRAGSRHELVTYFSDPQFPRNQGFKDAFHRRRS